jgi:hypothetical protein
MVNDKEQAMYSDKEVEQNLIARANYMGKQTIGKQFTIKLSDKGRANKVTCSGTIVECGYGYTIHGSFGKIQAAFKVVMEVGPNKVRREFHVLKVPQ